MKKAILTLTLALFIQDSLADATTGRMVGPGRNELGRLLLEKRLANSNAMQPSNRQNIRWESASYIGDSPTGDGSLKNCFYRTTQNYQFSIVYRGTLCPYSVDISPETGQVKYQ